MKDEEKVSDGSPKDTEWLILDGQWIGTCMFDQSDQIINLHANYTGDGTNGNLKLYNPTYSNGTLGDNCSYASYEVTIGNYYITSPLFFDMRIDHASGDIASDVTQFSGTNLYYMNPQANTLYLEADTLNCKLKPGQEPQPQRVCGAAGPVAESGEYGVAGAFASIVAIGLLAFFGLKRHNRCQKLCGKLSSMRQPLLSNVREPSYGTDACGIELTTYGAEIEPSVV